jgi:hypothetical protein
VLYQVQTRDRRRNLRLLLVVQVVETRDRLHERYIASAKLHDDSIGNVVLTSLNSSIFDEAIKSGLFSPEETLLMSRAIGAIDVYNLHATRFQSLPEIPAAGEEEAQAKAERTVISSVMQARDQVLKAMDNIYDQWPAREVHEAVKAHEQRGRTRPATIAEARYLTTKDN